MIETILFFAFFALIIVLIITKRVVPIFKQVKQDMSKILDDEGVDSLKQVASKINDAVVDATTTTCEYCGSKVEKSEDKCPNCGASISKQD